MRKPFLLFFFLLMASGLSAQSLEKRRYDVAAYIWPAFYNEPRFHEIGLFPEGKGEWETIYRAEPRFEGHRQPRVPLWGYEDESDPQVQEKIIRTATEYGVNTFIFDWYWYEDRPFLEAPLNAFLEAPSSRDMKFYIMWANHTANDYWDRSVQAKGKVYWRGETSRASFDGFVDHLVRDYFSKPNYYTIDGKPVFAIYELGTFINGMGGIPQARAALDALRARCLSEGLPGLHIQAILWSAIPESLSGVPGDPSSTRDNTLRQLGIESLTNYQWCHLVPANQDYQSWGEKATAMYGDFDRDFSVDYFPHVSVDWDNNPRFPSRVDAVTGVNPQKFEYFLRKAKDYVDTHPNQVPLVTINAWNEWSEGSYLEPDTEFGYGFLEAIRRVFK